MGIYTVQVQEEFILYSIANALSAQRYGFIRQFDLTHIISCVSDNFLGNYFRFEALFILMEGGGEKDVLLRFVRLAEKHYAQGDNKWGLALTYHLAARVEPALATDYYTKALQNFTICQHYRGIYLTIEALRKDNSNQNSEKNLETYHIYKQKYQNTLLQKKDSPLWEICCQNSRLDFELTLVVNGKIGPKLMNGEQEQKKKKLQVIQHQSDISENERTFATIKELKLNTNSAVNVTPNELSSIEERVIKPQTSLRQKRRSVHMAIQNYNRVRQVASPYTPRTPEKMDPVLSPRHKTRLTSIDVENPKLLDFGRRQGKLVSVGQTSSVTAERVQQMHSAYFK